MLTASWWDLAGLEALVRAAAPYVGPEVLHRTHEPLMVPTRALVKRGQRDGSFRTDLPVEWLLTSFYALMHAADEHARRHGLQREAALEMLTGTVRDLFAPPRSGAS